VYAEFGWAGFHFDRVAKRAEVSRDVLYRRYADKEALLLAALGDARLPTITGDGDIYERILTYARDIYSYFTSPLGVASLRLHIEAAQFPELYQAYRTKIVDPNIAGNVAALEAAAADGEIGPVTDSAATVEAIGGGVIIHALYSQHSGAKRGESPAVSDNVEVAVQSIVAAVLGHRGAARD
jgi:AcrR family transcriptional regulator